MNKLKSFIVGLLQIPICTCGNILESNRGIRTGITMDEARKYLVTPPHTVYSGKKSDGRRYDVWGWMSDKEEYISIMFVEGVVESYTGITSNFALVAMPTKIPQSSFVKA